MGGPQGQALREEEAWANVLRFQGAISGAEARAAVHRAPHPHQLPQLHLPHTRDVCVCVRLLPEGRASLLHSLGLVTAALAGIQHPCPPGPLCSWMAQGACMIRPGGSGSRALGGKPQPMPNACPHEASTNRTSFFCCHLTS